MVTNRDGAEVWKDVVAPVDNTPNSNVALDATIWEHEPKMAKDWPETLRTRCKQIPESQARSVHPNLFTYLESTNQEVGFCDPLPKIAIIIKGGVVLSAYSLTGDSSFAYSIIDLDTQQCDENTDIPLPVESTVYVVDGIAESVESVIFGL